MAAGITGGLALADGVGVNWGAVGIDGASGDEFSNRKGEIGISAGGPCRGGVVGETGKLGDVNAGPALGLIGPVAVGWLIRVGAGTVEPCRASSSSLESLDELPDDE